MIFTDLNLTLEIAIIIVIVLAAVVAIWGAILQLSIFFRYTANNRVHIGGKTAKQVAEEMLQRLGYTDIKVCRASYLWLLFFRNWGNRYSPRRKKILLYGNILKKDTVTAVALATQKVGLVTQHKQGDKQMKFRAKWELWTRPAPNLLLPIITIGVVIDLIINKGNFEANAFGIVTLVCVIISILYTIIAFYALFLIIPTERRAGEIALDAIKKFGIVPSQYIEKISSMYNVYVKKYIADFVLAILELIIDILRVVSVFAKKK